MISKSMEKALNQQIQLEGQASFIYLAMAGWCDSQGLAGCAEFMHRQSEEERAHMLKLYHYILEVDGTAVVPGIKQPSKSFKTIDKLFQQVYEHEQKVTAAIHKLTDLCYEENDHMTLQFLQWYIEEQKEEESMMRGILDTLKLIGEGPQRLYFIDREIRLINEKEMQNAEQEAN